MSIIFDSAFSAIAVAIITGMAGILTSFIAEKKADQEKIQKTKLENIAQTVTAHAEEAQAKAVEAIVNKLPAGQDAEEIGKKVIHNLQIRGDLVINNGNDQEKELVQDLVTGYHQQALSQARIQFWFSIFAATAGFIFILYSAKSVTSNDPASILHILPGAIIDAVALLFFRQAEQTRERATALYDRLRTDNQMRSARLLVESIDDVQIRSVAKAQIALHMSGLKPKDIDISMFMMQTPKNTSPN